MKDDNLLSVISEGLAEISEDGVYHQKLESALERLDNIWNPKPQVQYSVAAESPGTYFGREVLKSLPPKRHPLGISE